VSAPGGTFGNPYRQTSGRETSSFGASWGIPGAGLLRSLFNTVVPVAIVQRWRDEKSGSLYGLSGGTLGAFGHRPAVEIFSTESDWELNYLTVGFPMMEDQGVTGHSAWYDYAVNLFTGRAGYNPVEFNGVGPFGPNLITNAQFSAGSIRMQSGTNPINSPFGIGYLISQGALRVGTFSSILAGEQVADSFSTNWFNTAGANQQFIGVHKQMWHVHFDPPIRMKRGRTLCVQCQSTDLPFQFNPLWRMFVSALVNELPNPIGQFQT